MDKKTAAQPQSAAEPIAPRLTPAETYQAACEALRTRAFPGFEDFGNGMTARGRLVSWRPEFANEAYPSVRIAVADRDGQILDSSLVVDLRGGAPRLLWLVTPRGQARYSYTVDIPGGLSGIATDTVVRRLTHFYTLALAG